METKNPSPQKVKSFKRLILVLSIIIPLSVALLFEIKVDGLDFSFLPPIYASINGITAVLLVIAVLAIRNGNVKLHQGLMKTALACSLAFLVLYVLYHISSESTSYGGQYPMIYYFILISHIILSVGVVPLVLYTYFYAWKGDFKRHKKWTRFSFPIWLYVAVTGVVVYIMISPFYGN